MVDSNTVKTNGMQSQLPNYRWGKAKRDPKFVSLGGGIIEQISSPHLQLKWDTFKRKWVATKNAAPSVSFSTKE